ncbi:MAG: GltB/FmdC/FwdC-like GXGXG domain-containing protein [Armatimonadota bacterium]
MKESLVMVNQMDAEQGTDIDFDVRGMSYREVNKIVRGKIADGATRIVLRNVRGQRFLADGLRGKALTLEIHGVPGGDLAAFMDGPTVEIHGNCQDAAGNTMNDGTVIIHGNAGDALGYGMRGGDLFVRGSAGYRVGIHMKAFKQQVPTVIIGGTAGDFFGEYMAGGILVALGLDRTPDQRLVGDYLASGIHGGEIFLRATPEELPAARYLAMQVMQADQLGALTPHLQRFADAFHLQLDDILSAPFTRLVPVSHRPFAAKYAPA